MFRVPATFPSPAAFPRCAVFHRSFTVSGNGRFPWLSFPQADAVFLPQDGNSASLIESSGINYRLSKLNPSARDDRVSPFFSLFFSLFFPLFSEHAFSLSLPKCSPSRDATVAVSVPLGDAAAYKDPADASDRCARSSAEERGAVDFSSRSRGDFNARHRVRRIRRLTGASATRDNLATQPLARSLARSRARARARLDFRDKAPAQGRSKNLLTGVLIVARASHLRTDADKQVTQSEIINYGYFNCRLRAANVRPSARPSSSARGRAEPRVSA